MTLFLRLSQIVGDRRKNIDPIIPISRSTWWAGVKEGRYPPPIKLSPKVTVWHHDDVMDVINNPQRRWN